MKKLLYLILILTTTAHAQNVFHVPYDSAYKVPCDSIYYTYDTVKVKTDSVLKKTVWCSIGLVPCKFGYKYAKRIDTILHTATARCDAHGIFYRDSLGRKIVAGVLINQDGATVIYNKAAAAKDSLHVSYVREGIEFSNWRGKNNDLDNYRAKGLKVYLNITYTTCSLKPCPFPTAAQIGIIIANLEDCIIKYRDVIAAIFPLNEPFNQGYWTNTDRTDYNNLLIAIAVLGKKYSIPVYDGGLFSNSLEILAYRYYTAKGQLATVVSLKQCMHTWNVKEAENPANNPKLQMQITGDSLTMFVDKFYCTGVNVHLYYDSTDATQHLAETRIALTIIQRYVKDVTGKQLIMQETGIRNDNDPNTSPGAVTGLMQICEDLEIDFIFFSGNYGSAGSQGLFTDSGKLKDAGKAFKNFIDQNGL